MEEGALSIDETLRTRTQKLKARRSEVLTEIAKLKDRQALAVRRVNADTVKAFCAAPKERFTDPASGLGKAYLRLLVDEIKLDGNELVVTGSHRRLADAFGFMQKRKLGEVPDDRLKRPDADLVVHRNRDRDSRGFGAFLHDSVAAALPDLLESVL